VEEKKKAYRVCWGNLKEREHLDLGLWEDNIKIYLMGTG
jgi:hypothetical protein